VKGLRVYVAGPVNGSGKQNGNAARALEAAHLLQARGFVPFVPHLYWLWSFAHPEYTEEFWLSQCKSWLLMCDAMIRLPGASPGSDFEESIALEAGIPVFKVQPNEPGDHLVPARNFIAWAEHRGAKRLVGPERNRVDYAALDVFQASVSEWLKKQPFYPQKPHQPLIGIQEELGELSHAHLKSEQGIRGTAEEHHEAKRDAIGDILVYIAGYCEANGLQMGQCLERAWEEVRQRDWNKNRSTGAVSAPGPYSEKSK
jgi:NTP pyrophosphatase (non-canonical NTP hydrolase)